ncbi:hypothetical protein [Deinococcus sp.]|uniref:hypothetical protein n=1 Tax=Deinococcus sp. TaxID=47478 RepID=UPI00391900F3
MAKRKRDQTKECSLEEAVDMMIHARRYAVASAVLVTASIDNSFSSTVLQNDAIGEYDKAELPEAAMMNAFFAMELIFKALEGRRGKHLTVHSLSMLFNALPEDEKDELREAYNVSITMWDGSLDLFLERNQDSFVNSRYLHEKRRGAVFLPSHLTLSLWEAAAEVFPEVRYRLPI